MVIRDCCVPKCESLVYHTYTLVYDWFIYNFGYNSQLQCNKQRSDQIKKHKLTNVIKIALGHIYFWGKQHNKSEVILNQNNITKLYSS